MVAAKVTEEKVFEFANSIVLQGERPTVLRLHKALGVGSYSTIQKYLKNWEQSEAGLQAKEAALPDELELPTSATEAMNVALKAIWVVAEASARERIEQNANVNQLELDAQEVLIEEVLTKSGTTELRLIEAEKRISLLEQEREKNIDERATLREQLATSKLTLNQEKVKNEELVERHSHEIDRVNSLLIETKDALKALEISYADKEEKLTSVIELHDSNKQSLATTTAQLDAANDSLNELHIQVNETKTDLLESQKKIVAEVLLHDETKEKLSGANADFKAAERLITNIEAQLLELKQTNGGLIESVNTIRLELTESKISESKLRGELSTLSLMKEENTSLRNALDCDIARYIEGLGNKIIKK